MNNNNGGGVVIVILIALFLFQGGGQPAPVPGPGPTPVVSEAMQKHVSSLRDRMSSADSSVRLTISKGFSDLADVLDANPGRINTSQQMTLVCRDMATILSRSAGLKGKVDGFSAAVESSIGSVFGADTVVVEQAKAIEFIRALAWACGG